MEIKYFQEKLIVQSLISINGQKNKILHNHVFRCPFKD